jgi:hypothetical protein
MNKRIDKKNIATSINQPESGTSDMNTSAQEQNQEIKNKDANLTSENETVKYNMVQVHTCSTELHQWKNDNGISADVYQLIDPKSSEQLPLSLPLSDSQSPICFLSYTYIAQTPDESSPPSAIASNKEDTLMQSQMLKTLDKDAFIKSQVTKIDGLQKFDVMDLHLIAHLPPRARLLSSIWSYRRKRLPNGVLLKYKSQLCVNGKEQSFGHDYWETYAPVASWATIRMLLILSSLQKFEDTAGGLYAGTSSGALGRSSIHVHTPRLVR